MDVGTDECLQTLSKRSTWEVLLNAVKIRHHVGILKMANTAEIPKLYYHRKCYQQFSMKCLLDRIKVKQDKRNLEEQNNATRLQALIENVTEYQREDIRSKRRDSSLSSPVLPNECIFCKKK